MPDTKIDHFESLFEYAPISLWEEDYSGIKIFFDELRANGVTDFNQYLNEHPKEIVHSMNRIMVTHVNAETLRMFGAKTEKELLSNLDKVFRDEMRAHFRAELMALWNGEMGWSGDGVNYRLDGEALYIRLHWRILPECESNWECVLVSIEDITARKKAEDYLRYLGTHDVMTGLYNRAYFEEALQKFEAHRVDPISVMILDLNGLKETNDNLGHHTGDSLIRRTGEVLKASIEDHQIAARIGGDEFAIIMHESSKEDAQAAMDRIQSLVDMNNKYYRDPQLSLSMGAATSESGFSLEKVISLADDAMYRNKGLYHRRRREDK